MTNNGASTVLVCGDKLLDLTSPCVMGILNVTPDSFSDGGALGTSISSDSAGFFVSVDKALCLAEQMVLEGAKIIDVGGESTRPGAPPVAEQEEIDRVLPVLEAIRERLDVIVSVDTSSPALISEAVAAGAGMVNDIRALQRPGALQAAANSKMGVCLMHMQGEPGNMQIDPHYDDVVQDVYDFLLSRMRHCLTAGIDRSRLCVDPGFGFGKTTAHNYRLLRELVRFGSLGVPVLAGVSRKSMIGAVTGRCVAERLPGSIAGAVFAALNGAGIIRVHDVAATCDALKVLSAAQQADRHD